MAMQSFLAHGVRHGRPLRSLVTYNTWFSYGVAIDESSLRAEMELAAEMGFEQFVVDAGWWTRTREPDDNGDFIHDWGNWDVDRDRFPAGLGSLTDRAHELGLRFGIWVEPERVDRSTVGTAGLAKERFLATDSGRYDPGVPNSEAVSAQICLVDGEARQWVLDKLFEFLDDAHPDYLKWDNNFWINCNRAGHGHGSEDGNFRHMQALHDVLDQLRERYPDMDIENCASGGNRLSLDLLGATDAAWIDDRSAPSRLVRHNLEGLSWFMPPAYLFSFAMAGDEEPVYDDPPLRDLSTLLRSRMSGVLGATWIAGNMNEGTHVQIAKQIALYKAIRPILQDGGSILLSHQLTDYPGAPSTDWDAVEHLSRQSGEAVVFAFDTTDGPSSTLIKPRGLRAQQDYDVESADFGPLGTVRGDDLMSRGVQLDKTGISKSHVLIFRIHHD
jgi:alpha-galactosidase